MSIGQRMHDTQTPIATDEEVAKGFLNGLNNAIHQSREAYPSTVATDRIGKNSMPRPGVWGKGFCKP